MSCFFNGVKYFIGRIWYSPPYWDDLRVPLTTARVGANAPAFVKLVDNGAGSTGVYAHHFSASVVEELHFWAQLPHSWVEGGTIYPHVHWCAENTGAGTVIWGLEYSFATLTGTFPNTTLDTTTVSTTGVARQHLYAALSPIPMPGCLISSLIGCRIYRNATADTYGSRAVGLDVDFHYQLNTPGSRTELVK